MRYDLGASASPSGSRADASSPSVSTKGFDPARGVFTEDYIDGAATARYSAYRSDGTLFCDQVSNYEPPDNGIHLCGVTDDEEQPTTVALYEMYPSEAERYFEIAKRVACCGEDEADFVVDLCIDGSIDDDFWSNRQLWSLAIRAWNSELASGMSPSGRDRGTGHEAKPASPTVATSDGDAPKDPS